MAETPSGFVTVTSTHVGLDEAGGTTEMEFSLCPTIVPLPSAPKLTAVALAKPPPRIVMAPLPLSGPVLGDDRRNRGAAVGALERDGEILIDGRAQPAGGVVAHGGLIVAAVRPR